MPKTAMIVGISGQDGACLAELLLENGYRVVGTSRDVHAASPYAVAKAAAFWQVRLYREAYGMRACSGILFNHESPFRSRRFVTMKIARAVCDIAGGRQKELVLGNLDISRDWGWAPEYVHAMWLIVQLDEPQDLIIASGRAYSLHDFLQAAFEVMDLDWSMYVPCDPAFFRPSDPRVIVGDPTKAFNVLGWKAAKQAPEIARNLVESISASPG